MLSMAKDLFFEGNLLLSATRLSSLLANVVDFASRSNSFLHSCCFHTGPRHCWLSHSPELIPGFHQRSLVVYSQESCREAGPRAQVLLLCHPEFMSNDCSLTHPDPPLFLSACLFLLWFY